MDLALLVYGISLLSGFMKLFIFLIVASIITIAANGIYYVDYCNAGTDVGTRTIARMWKAFWVGMIAFVMTIFTPTEKTAYTMVGAYAAQKVSENDKVQQMSGKVLTIIEQQLDGYIEQGIKEAEEKVKKTVKEKK
jgi:hypothetical protein